MRFPLEGGCLCGEVTYRVDREPLDAAYCHCTLCRRAAGAPAVPWGTVAVEGFAFTKGKPAVYRSSERGERKFCARCGTQLTFQYVGNAKTIDFTLASLSDPEAVKPQYHIWTKSRVAWFDTADALPRHEEKGPDTWE